MEEGEQDRWFWVFGTGSRRCFGQNPAFEGEYFVYALLISLIVLRYCIAAMFTNFETVMSGDAIFMGADGFVTGKGGGKLYIMFKRLE